MISINEIIASEEVQIDLSYKTDDLYNWVTKREIMFKKTTESVQKITTSILNRYPKFVKNDTGKDYADPFVIAVAHEYNTCVITDENYGSENKPKIPFICEQYKIRSISLLEFIKEQKWIF